MRRKVGIAGRLAGLVVLAPLAGCGSQQELDEYHLQVMALGYHWAVSELGRPPSGPEEIEPYMHEPKAVEALHSGRFVILWNGRLETDPDAAAKTVLGFHRDTPEKGGPVLMSDGHATSVSAEQFKSLRKVEIGVAPSTADRPHGDGTSSAH